MRALIVIDVQRGFDDAAFWGKRNNPDAEANIRALLEAWQRNGDPIVFARHNSDKPGSPLRAGSEGNEFKPELDGIKPDFVVNKSVHSAFHGTENLHTWLTARGITDLVTCGIQTNRCVETTTRVGGDLGYRIDYVLDATFTFDEIAQDGSVVTADEIARVVAVNLHNNFATVTSTQEVLKG